MQILHPTAIQIEVSLLNVARTGLSLSGGGLLAHEMNLDPETECQLEQQPSQTHTDFQCKC